MKVPKICNASQVLIPARRFAEWAMVCSFIGKTQHACNLQVSGKTRIDHISPSNADAPSDPNMAQSLGYLAKLRYFSNVHLCKNS